MSELLKAKPVYWIKIAKRIHGSNKPHWLHSGAVMESHDGRRWGSIDQWPPGWDGKFALFEVDRAGVTDAKPPDIQEEPF